MIKVIDAFNMLIDVYFVGTRACLEIRAGIKWLGGKKSEMEADTSQPADLTSC